MKLVLMGGVALALTPVLAAPIALAPTDARAQTAPAAKSAAQQGPEEVVVTARRRSESLQSVPVAVSVVNGSTAQKDNRFDIQTISAIIPTVEFRTSASNKDRTVFVRGVGTISTSPGVEPSVSTVLDGVVLARPGQSTADILDLDHIEALRGPQGTLFGKNASAGVVNIVTKTPGDEFRGYADASYFGGGDEYRIAGGVSGPLEKGRLRGQISGLVAGYDGNVKNLFTGGNANGYDHKAVRGKLVFTPSDALTVTLTGDFVRSDDKIPTGVFLTTNRVAYPTGVVSTNPALLSALAGQGVTPSYTNRTVNTNVNSGVKDDNGGVAAQVDYTFGGGYTLTSITAYRDWQNTQTQDFDQMSVLSSSFAQLVDLGKVSFHQISEEARIASPKGGLVDYVVGAFFLNAVDDEVYRRDITRLVSGAPVSDNGVATYGTTGNNYSLFGEANVNFTSSFRALAGLRLVRDELKYYHGRVSTSAVALTGIQPSVSSSGSTSEDNYAARAGLQYDVSREVTTYVTYSRGYKGPAFNVFFNMLPFTAGGVLRDAKVLKPETSNAYEAGVKSRFLDNKLQVNLALFETQFDNYQANFPDLVAGAVVTRLINAGKVQSRGVEGDLSAFLTDRLSLTGAFAFTDAKVKSFICPVGAAASCNIDNKPLPFAPRTKFNIRADYLAYSGERYDVSVNTDYSWQSKTQDQLAETADTIQPAYGIWNARVSLSDKQAEWQLNLLVKNITNKHYYSYLAGGNLGGLVGWVPRDFNRYFGLSLHKDF